MPARQPLASMRGQNWPGLGNNFASFGQKLTLNCAQVVGTLLSIDLGAKRDFPVQHENHLEEEQYVGMCLA